MTASPNIATALAKAQAEMTNATKDAANPHFKSRYADLASVRAACMPALNRHGIAVIQPYASTEAGEVVKTILIHESGETLECAVPVILGKRDMQGLGSAYTYARRYGLLAMAGIAPDDDDGNAAAQSVAEMPQFDPVGFRDRVKRALENARSLPDLKIAFSQAYQDAGWRMLPPPMQAELEAAKDARKAALTDHVNGGQAPVEEGAYQ